VILSSESAGAVREEIEKVLTSAGFAHNQRLCGFLRFVVEQMLAGKGDQLKESVIGVEVFGRPPDYDVRQDSIVRTEAAKLRARLARYYTGEGALDPVVIVIPKGGYAPMIEFPERRGQSTGWRRLTWLPPVIAAAAVLIAGTVGTLLVRPEPKSIAVLPLENRSPEPGSELFADGLTDEIIQNLSAVEGLDVRSHTSSFAFKGKPRNIREAGRQLGVDFVVEGWVARSPDQIRVSVQLVRARNDTALWNGRWARESVGVFAIQDDISRAIVNQLRLKLGGGQRRYTTDVEAYALYLQARNLMRRRAHEDVRESVRLYEQVLAKDAGFSPAYAGLAEAHNFRSSMPSGGEPFLEGNRRVRECADKALQLDPLLPDAWVFRGVSLVRDSQWTDAEKAFRRAIELSPSLADAHEYYGDLLFRIGRQGEGLCEIRKAVKLDPLAVGPLVRLSFLLVTSARTNEGLEAVDRLRRIDPNYPWIKQQQGRLLLQRGKVLEAVPYFQAAGDDGLLGLAYGLLGRRTEAEELRRSTKNPGSVANICAGLGDKDCVFEALNRMADIKDPEIYFYLVKPEMSIIRGDPRLVALKKKVGL
jgi:TolB-like protein